MWHLVPGSDFRINNEKHPKISSLLLFERFLHRCCVCWLRGWVPQRSELIFPPKLMWLSLDDRWEISKDLEPRKYAFDPQKAFPVFSDPVIAFISASRCGKVGTMEKEGHVFLAYVWILFSSNIISLALSSGNDASKRNVCYFNWWKNTIHFPTPMS